MRARRLRRLGVASAGTPGNASDSAMVDAQDSQKNDIKSTVRKEDSEEIDENQHKQKLQKFDESIKDCVLNNNELELGKFFSPFN